MVNDRELQASIVQQGEHAGYKILGIDPAAGGDNSAIVLKSANLQQVLFNQKLQNTMDLTMVAADLYRQHHCDLIVVDKVGVGQGVYDRLKDMDFPIRGVSFGEEASDFDNHTFTNIKAELHWRERKWLLGGGRLLANDGWNEFEYVKYKRRSTDEKIGMQPKEDLFRQGLLSPNCVDAAVLTMCVSDTTIKNARVYQANGGRFSDKMIEIWRQ